MNKPAPRNLCVLFGDVAGSTRLYEILGDAQAHHAVDRCMNRMEKASLPRRHGQPSADGHRDPREAGARGVHLARPGFPPSLGGGGLMDYDRLIQESLERENSLIACTLDMERLLSKRMLAALDLIADRAVMGAKYGSDMHSSSQLVLRDIERIARDTIRHLNTMKGTP